MAETNPKSNPDPFTKAPGSHPVATGVGAAAAGAAGAAIGSIVPGIGTVIGGVVGAIAGSVGGGYAGKSVGEMINPTETDEYWRENHKTRDYAKDSSYDQLQPAYAYGATLADSTDEPAFDEKRVKSDWESNPASKGLNFDTAKGAIQDEFNRKIQLREEQLRVNKDRVSTGEVSVRKEVTVEKRTIEVPVEREEVVVTRRAVAGSQGDGGVIADQEIRIPTSEERVRVSKDTVVTGEVDVAKRKVTDTEVVSDDIRKESLKVDSQGGVRIEDQKEPLH